MNKLSQKSIDCAYVLASLGNQAIKRNFKQIFNETKPFILYSGNNINTFGDYDACLREKN